MKLKHKTIIGLLSISLLASCAAHGDVESLLTDKNLNGNRDIVENELQDNEATLLQDETLLEKRRAALLLADYIKLENNQYSLTLSQPEAAKLDIDEGIYQLIVEQISAVNSTIAEAIERGYDVKLMDIQARSKSYKTPQTSIRNRPMLNASRTMDGGIINTRNGNHTASFNVKSGIKKVILKCGTYWVPVVSYTCSVSCFGKTKNYVVTGSLHCIRTIESLLDASGANIIATISFTSTDPNGSFCIWNPSY